MQSSFITSLLHATSLISGLSQRATNGESLLGTLDAPFWPKYLPDHSATNGLPWGHATVSTTKRGLGAPNTGVVRRFDFTVARGVIAPDGVNKSVLLINGAFPGPALQANWGDTFEVTVRNRISDPEEGTSLHFHGLFQQGTPFYDGVAAVSQCPIAPGKSMTYTFKADPYGSSFYHSHFASQYVDGVYGPIVIHGPSSADYDIDVGPVLLTDYFHENYLANEAKLQSKPVQLPFSQNNLINGKMQYNCSLVSSGQGCSENAGLSKFRFQTGKRHLLRLINAGGEGFQRFSIDSHSMTVIANDFVPIVPYETNVVSLGVGQRADVIVKATGKPTDAVWMRSNMSTQCSITQQPYALAPIYYSQANTSGTPRTVAHPYTETGCINDPLASTVPASASKPPPQPATTTTINMTFNFNATGSQLFFMDGYTFRPDNDQPMLLLARTGNTSYPNPEWNVYNYGFNSSMRIILLNSNPIPHPMHMHGHDFWVLAEGTGAWDGVITRPNNPQRRDTQMVGAGTPDKPAYIVLEVEANNAGVWPLHCHVAWHVTLGMFVNILEAPARLKYIPFPPSAKQTCRDWWAYTGWSAVAQIDSGL